MEKRTWSIQTAKSRMITARLPLDEFDRLKAFCDSENLGVTETVRLALSYFMDEFEKGGSGDSGK